MEITKKKLLELEALMSSDKKEALEKMVDLYQEASDNYDHETCDAIELWIYEMGDVSIIDHIKYKSAKIEDGGLKKKYTQWISWLKDK